MRLIQLPALAGSCLGVAGRAGALAAGAFAAGALAAGALVAGVRAAGAFAGVRAAGLFDGLTGCGTGFFAGALWGVTLAGTGFLAGALADMLETLLCTSMVRVNPFESRYAKANKKHVGSMLGMRFQDQGIWVAEGCDVVAMQLMQGCLLARTYAKPGGLDCRYVDLRCAGKVYSKQHRDIPCGRLLKYQGPSHICRLVVVDGSWPSDPNFLGQILKWEAAGRISRFRVELAHALLRSTEEHINDSRRRDRKATVSSLVLTPAHFMSFTIPHHSTRHTTILSPNLLSSYTVFHHYISTLITLPPYLQCRSAGRSASRHPCNSSQ